MTRRKRNIRDYLKFLFFRKQTLKRKIAQFTFFLQITQTHVS